MQPETEQHDNSDIYMDCSASVIAPENPGQCLTPWPFDEHAGQSGSTLGEKCDNEQQVEQPLQQTEPLDSNLLIQLLISPF